MDIRFWGLRGGVPVPGRDAEIYGGNTACLEVRCGGTLIILDAGSGLIRLGQQLMLDLKGKELNAHLLLSHLHWDHTMGIPYFLPVYRLSGNLRVYGVAGTGDTLLSFFQGAEAGDFFPVSLGKLTAEVSFQELKELTEIGNAKISYYYLNHPGLTIGFRIEYQGKSLVYLTDNEPYRRSNIELAHEDQDASFLARIDREVVQFAQHADLLIADASYSEEEQDSRAGSGHSSVREALQIALSAAAKRLVLFHHPPWRTDSQIEALIERCRKRVESLKGKLEVLATKEGDLIQI